MKPPGGDCHDLFGAEFNGSPSHQRVLKPPGGGSSDIFGRAAEPLDISRKIRTQHQSSLSFGSEDTPSKAFKTEGNPVTGEGYDDVIDKSSSNNSSISSVTTPAVNGNASPAEAPTLAPVVPRKRVPPGGFSSGLW